MTPTFQFTHPGKGATAPPTACALSRSRFNSRTLGRVRPSLPHSFFYPHWFQFTHPGKGATQGGRCKHRHHASFNSRTLGRVRRSGGYRHRGVASFNSRTLGRVRLLAGALHWSDAGVSIHAPWEGCDLGLDANNELDKSFNSRTLGRVRLCAASSSLLCIPRFNSRTLGRVRPHTRRPTTLLGRFQFTHPGKGATLLLNGVELSVKVSIHAPWEGCDLCVGNA